MKFKTDENLPAEVAERFRLAGFDAMTVVEQRLSGAPDARVAEVCHEEARVLVTLDLDFADIRAHPPGTGPGVIILRPRTQARADVLALAVRVIAALESESVAGNLWIVDEQRLRIRER
jgi:predicted nuclease of predicted toxin-antitoxin system